jgi:hypothetical protein
MKLIVNRVMSGVNGQPVVGPQHLADLMQRSQYEPGASIRRG